MARVRVRQHVNPLSNKYQDLFQLPDWEKVYSNINRPLHLDIGCAWGKCLLSMAQLEPEWNFLGIEIRQPLVEKANQWREELGLKNLHFLFANFNTSMPQILESLPPEVLQRVTIQFPDPWFKQKHRKRRLVQPELVEGLAKYMPAGSTVFLQSDIEALAKQMRDRFQSNPAFQLQGNGEWLAENPLPVPTERELATLEQGGKVYRALFRC